MNIFKIESNLDCILNFYKKLYWSKESLVDKEKLDEIRRKTSNNNANRYDAMEEYLEREGMLHTDKFGIRVITPKGLIFEGYRKHRWRKSISKFYDFSASLAIVLGTIAAGIGALWTHHHTIKLLLSHLLGQAK